MTTPLAEISEKNATGEVARIYADIRESTGLPLVNLIFRNMATIEGCLAWAWGGLRPLYTHDAIYAAAERIAAAAHGNGDEASRPWRKDRVVADTLESYRRGNMLNMIGLFVLSRAGNGGGEIGDPFTPERIAQIMPLPDLATLPAPSMERLKVLTRMTEGESPLIPSIFRHFAHDPEAIAEIEKIVMDMTRGGRLSRMVDAMTEAGKEAAQKFPAPQPPNAEIAREIEKLTALFTPTMARMTILATAMRA